jgi:hypothetical protein
MKRSRVRISEAHVKSVRIGHGANCSSIGSVVDTLFASAVVGGAIFAAALAALASEPVKIVGDDAADEEKRREEAKEAP